MAPSISMCWPGIFLSLLLLRSTILAVPFDSRRGITRRQVVNGTAGNDGDPGEFCTAVADLPQPRDDITEIDIPIFGIITVSIMPLFRLILHCPTLSHRQPLLFHSRAHSHTYALSDRDQPLGRENSWKATSSTGKKRSAATSTSSARPSTSPTVKARSRNPKSSTAKSTTPSCSRVRSISSRKEPKTPPSKSSGSTSTAARSASPTPGTTSCSISRSVGLWGQGSGWGRAGFSGSGI